MKIFKNCKSIIIDYEDSGKSNLQASFFYHLIDHLKELNQNEKCKLKEIRVLNAKYLKGKFDNSFKKYAAFIIDYQGIGWRFDIQNDGKKVSIYKYVDSKWIQ